MTNFQGKFVLPLFLFEDDCELGNGLGAHAGKNKMCATYTSIPCFPPQFVSQLNNIMQVSLAPSNHRKESTNAEYHQTLISELENLTTSGLEV